MKVVLYIYIVSWIILLVYWIISLFNKDKHDTEKLHWILKLIIILLGPISAALCTYLWYLEYFTIPERGREDSDRIAEKNTETIYRQETMRKLRAVTTKLPPTDNTRYILSGETIIKYAENRDYDALFKSFTHISIPVGSSLFIKECEHSGHGSSSSIVIKRPDGTNETKIFDYIKVEDSCEGAWEAYMLAILWHVLPLFWHALYSCRTFLFSQRDLANIHIFQREDDTVNIVKMIETFDCEPEIVKTDGKYYVSCCYWSDYEGFMQQTVEITIHDNKASFYFVDNIALVEYHSEIRF